MISEPTTAAHAPQGAEGISNYDALNFEPPEYNEMLTGVGGLPDAPRLNIASLNCSGLSGKTHLISNLMNEYQLDFISVSETWCRKGSTARLFADSVFIHEYDAVTNGRAHYGQAILFNRHRCDASEFSLQLSDPDRHLTIFCFRGIRFVTTYTPPGKGEAFANGFFGSLAGPFLDEIPTVLMGDLNARSAAFGDSTGNAYGTALEHLLQVAPIERLMPTSGHWTFISNAGRSVVDHVLINTHASNLSPSLIVDEDFFLGLTEHAVLRLTIRGPLPPALNPGAPRPWNRARLNDPERSQAYIAALGESHRYVTDQLTNILSSRPLTQNEVDAADTLIIGWIEQALSTHIGRSPARPQCPQRDFMTPELARQESILAATLQEIRSLSDPQMSLALLARYTAESRAHQKAIDARREEMFREFVERFRNMQPPEQLRTMHAIKNRKARANASGLRTDTESLEHYRRHFANQYSNTQPEFPTAERPCPAPVGDPDCVFSLGAVSFAISMLPKGKATGNSGIPSEALSVAAPIVAGPIQMLFEACWNMRMIPKSWKEARIHPIHKKGDQTDISNYRPISLTEVVRRLFETLLLPLVTEAAEPLSIEQGGFRTGRGTIDQIATLNEWIAQTRHQRKPRYMAFLDIKAAYDQVDRSILWRKCEKKGFPTRLTELLKALFDQNSSCIAINGQKSEPFPLLSGLLQGSPISPVLYSLFIDDMVDDLNGFIGVDSLKLGDRHFCCLLYADDIVLFSSSYSDLQSLLEICEIHSLRNRYRFSVRKCEAVFSSVPADRPRPTVYGEQLPLSDSFVYLGIPISANGIKFKDLCQRNGLKALQAAHFFKNAGCNGVGFDNYTCLRIYQAFVRPILEYGLCLCPASIVKKFQSYAGKCIRLMTSTGKSASATALGLFGEVQPVPVRASTLTFKYCNKTRRKTPAYAVHYALQAFTARRTTHSTFAQWSSNNMIRAWDRERFGAQLENRSPVYRPLKEMQDQAIETLTRCHSSAFIWRGKDRRERKTLAKAIASCDRKGQRMIVNWVLNRSVGSWNTCRSCREQVPATKAHVESHLTGNRRRTRGGPSWIEEKLADAQHRGDVERLILDIRVVIGDRPADDRDAEPP